MAPHFHSTGNVMVTPASSMIDEGLLCKLIE